MDHEEAVREQAAERYVLGELPAGQREAFEEHFFQCPECAREVQLGAVFLANVRTVLAEQAQRQRARLIERILDWKPLLPAALAACLVLALSTGYLALVSVPALKKQVAGLTAPQSYPAVFLKPVLRGEEQVIEIPRQSMFLGLAVDVPLTSRAAHYRCDFLTEGDQRAAFIVAPAPQQPGAPLNLLLSPSALRSGRYTLVLQAAEGPEGGRELGRFSFRLHIR